MPLVSVRSVDPENGYDFSNDFAEALIVDPNSKISLINCYYERNNLMKLGAQNAYFFARVDAANAVDHQVNIGELQSGQTITANGVFPTGGVNGGQLAALIEDAYNRKFAKTKHRIVVGFNPDAKKFSINSVYTKNSLSAHYLAQPVLVGGELGAYDASNGTIPCNGVTLGTGNYLITKGEMETLDVPDQAQGGSIFQAEMTTAVINSNNATNKGFCIGLIQADDTAQVISNTDGCVSDAKCAWMFAGISYSVTNAGVGLIEVFEKGAKVLSAPLNKVLIDASYFKIELHTPTDAAADPGHVNYYYKNGNNKWTQIVIDTPTLEFKDWDGAQIKGVVGTDQPAIASIADLQMTYSGQSHTKVVSFAPGSDGAPKILVNGLMGYRSHSDFDSLNDAIYRLGYGANAVEDADVGVVGPLIVGGQSSQLVFQVDSQLVQDRTATTFFGILHETQRVANVAAGATLGSTSVSAGVTAVGDGGGAAAVAAPNKSPFIIQFRIIDQDANNLKIQYRQDQNKNTVVWVDLKQVQRNTIVDWLIEVIGNASADSCFIRYKLNSNNKNYDYISQPFSVPMFTAGSANHIVNYNLSTFDHRHHFLVNRWVGAATNLSQTQPHLYNLNLVVSDNSGSSANYKDFSFGSESTRLGSYIGMTKNLYIFDPAAKTPVTEIIGEGTWNPIHRVLEQYGGVDEEYGKNLFINIPSLNVRNLIGSKLLASAVNLNDANLIGNRQGTTRFIAKIPRYWNDNGDSNATNVDGFYYDYFPYSCNLHNAKEMNMNDFKITFTDGSGKLATDIAYSELLLYISRVESSGESPYNPKISAPRDMGQTEVQRDILKSQMPPTLK